MGTLTPETGRFPLVVGATACGRDPTGLEENVDQVFDVSEGVFVRDLPRRSRALLYLRPLRPMKYFM